MSNDNYPGGHGQQQLMAVHLYLSSDLSFAEVDDIAELLAGQAVSVALLEPDLQRDCGRKSWEIEWHFAVKLDEDAVRAQLSSYSGIEKITIETLENKDWLEEVYKGYPPIETERFFVHGSHYKDPVPEGKIAVIIDAATAFGTGEHPTTKGCLLAMEALAAKGAMPKRILDVGCGSGILAIAAAKLWDVPVLAVDIDPESVRVTNDYISRNQVEDKVSACVSEGFDASEISKAGLYDLILANILAEPLIMIAQDVVDHLADNGIAILSGLLDQQADDVSAAYIKAGRTLASTNIIDEWATLVIS